MTTAIPWDIDHLTIRHGSHSAPNGKVQACAMEAAYLRYAARQGWDKKRTVAGWTDTLDCVCPTIGAFVRCWNDNISSDEVRTRIFTPELLDLLPDTKGGDALMLRVTSIWTVHLFGLVSSGPNSTFEGNVIVRPPVASWQISSTVV